MSKSLPTTRTPLWERQPDPGSRDGAIHEHFGLSYANYLVIARSLLQSMPLEWQERFVGCLNELDEAFYGVVERPAYNVQTLKRRPELITPWIDCDECEGTGENPEEGGDCEFCDEGQVEDPEGYRYETPEEVGISTDPIPHYDRGRTRLERQK